MTSRGKNFTEKEKCKLLELVQKNKHVIENKCTNAVTTLKKNEVWEVITNEFNSMTEVRRTQKQLTTAYFNLKRSTRHNVANENVKKYLEHKQNQTVSCEAGPSQLNTQNETSDIQEIITQLKKDDIPDQKGIRAPGGGTYTTQLSSIGAEMLAIIVMGDQIKSPSNTCDSAPSYHKKDEDCEIVIPLQDIIESSDNQDVIDTPVTKMPQHKTMKTKNKMFYKKKKNVMKSEALKLQYYEKKMECAILEKKIKTVEYKAALKKQRLLDIEIKIKQKEYENLIKQSM